jgi:type VI secretion system secreted protein Hcp
VEFTYRKLTKTHEVASTSESDDWRSMSQKA